MSSLTSGKRFRCLSPMVATLLLILVTIPLAYLIYVNFSAQQSAAKQAQGSGSPPPLIAIEGVTPTNYSIIAYVRAEKTQTTVGQAYLYDLNNTLVARAFTLTAQTLPTGQAVPVELYLNSEAPPGQYKLVIYTTRGTSAAKYFQNPTGTGKTTILWNLTAAYTSDTNSLNTSDSIAIYKAWVDAGNDRVYWNVSALTTITYLRTALYNESGANLVDSGVANNPYVSPFTPFGPPNYDSNWWNPVNAAWAPFVIIYTVKTS